HVALVGVASGLRLERIIIFVDARIHRVAEGEIEDLLKVHGRRKRAGHVAEHRGCCGKILFVTRDVLLLAPRDILKVWPTAVPMTPPTSPRIDKCLKNTTVSSAKSSFFLNRSKMLV